MSFFIPISKPYSFFYANLKRLILPVQVAQMYLNFKVFNVEYRALIFSTRTIKSITSKKTKEPYLEYPNGLKHKHLRAGEICQLDYHCY